MAYDVFVMEEAENMQLWCRNWMGMWMGKETNRPLKKRYRGAKNVNVFRRQHAV